MRFIVIAILAIVGLTGCNAEKDGKAGEHPSAKQLDMSQSQLVPSIGENEGFQQSQLVPSVGASPTFEQSQLVPSVGESPAFQQSQLVPELGKSENLLSWPFPFPIGQTSFGFPSQYQYQAQPNYFGNYQYIPISNDYTTSDTSSKTSSSTLLVLLFTLLSLQSSTTTTTTAATTTVLPTTATTAGGTTITDTTPQYFGWTSFNNCRYLLYRTTLTHNAAQTYCAGLGAQLAVTNMKTALDRSYLAATIGILQSEMAWFGLEDADGTSPGAIFIDGSSYTVTTGKTDDYIGASVPKCAFYSPSQIGSLVSGVKFTDCDTSKFYSICEVCP